MKIIKITLLAGTLYFSACKTTKDTAVVTPKLPLDCSTKSYSYAADVKYIIETNCSNCHGVNGDGGLNFFNLADVKKAALNGSLLGTIKHQQGFPRMPANGSQLDQAYIDKIECWVNTGMKE